MKICHILAGNEEGGLENHVEMLCNALVQKKEYEIHLIAHEKYRDRFDSKVQFHALDLSKGRKNPLLLLNLWRTIRQIDPDIIHAHANKAVAMIATLRPFLPKKIKRVATLHSQKRNLKSFETFDYVIGVSRSVIAPLKMQAKSVVYNGIAIPEIDENPDYLKAFGIDGGFVLCAVGRLERVKNFELLLHAIKALDVTLLLVGDGSQKEKLQALAERLQIEHKVRFTGFRDDVPALLYHSDLCVISSQREGFSYVMAEALLLERPVVSTDVADMKYILPKGCVVPCDDVQKLAAQIAYVQSHYERVIESYQNAFAFAKTHFTLEAMVTGTQKVYDEVGRP